MIGPTGCGKTEIARRLAKLADAPFIKVEATKFTEVGYHGRDVDAIIKDLVENVILLVCQKLCELSPTGPPCHTHNPYLEVENAILLVRQKLRERSAAAIRATVEGALLKLLIVQHPEQGVVAAAVVDTQASSSSDAADVPPSPAASTGPGAAAAAAAAMVSAFEAIKERLRNQELEGLVIELEVPAGGKGAGGAGGAAGPINLGAIDLSALAGSAGAGAGTMISLQSILGSRKEKRRMSVAEARTVLEEAEAERLFPAEVIAKEAVRLTENDGIVFIDEIDKIVPGRDASWRGGDPSSLGVQRDLLPIIEGSTVSTKHGNVETDHILFICSGAFHACKPSDLMAELQGRLPIRVELKALGRAEFLRILTEPQFNLLKQQQMLLASEGVDLHFTDAAVAEIARIAEEANIALENIGARRLHTVIERIVEPISFSAPDLVAQARAEGKERFHSVVDREQVVERLAPLLKRQDLAKFVI
ncbi:hypothetical protein FOA52_001522 [Chlamydomonas sp. UWO 241]|nr:hypothetical protein FOA52_001522 [Chlamydomonas sp. UWO 241]